MAEAACPAACGELLQGWLLGGEKLISCPINWFSRVSVSEGVPIPDERPRMRQMVNLLLDYWQEPPEWAAGLRIEYQSTIPLAKGMAGSTADIAATAQATARLLGKSLNSAELAQLCVKLEPTDSTIFRPLTLFDHLTAQTQISFDWQPDIDILLLESPQTILTEKYHQQDHHRQLLDTASLLQRAWQQFLTANQRHDHYRLGEACTLSAIASQSILPKPCFDQLRDVVEQTGIYGLNVAHSGSVVGLLFHSHHHDINDLRWWLHQKKISGHYPNIHHVKLIAGGVR
ncbi:GHMP family kinase ATP-binding protein [Xenorhabdus sp. IM139775]|uniref:GHMP family kinase ATP-binding protein n=1 Tax=Xenorhabdus sp. IM139775 TaxID=3025876 RepID=UPI00235987D3|nr:GHMP kinase [Xenorhabdus sp. IM139775]MDC9594849.1 GHMP kinase [Xenorhabdus sp. IM139775]